MDLKNHKSEIYSSYILTNILGIDSNFYDKIDCVFSFIPATRSKFKSGDFEVVDANLNILSPVYVYSSSFSGMEHGIINVNSKDIDRTHLINNLKNVSDSVVLSENYIKK